MHYIYKIEFLTNNKIYIGQTKDLSDRWNQHKNLTKKENPPQIVNRAMKKHGIDNCKFEAIACGLTQDDANWLEEELIKQYNSHIKNGKGYNVSLGGNTAPKSEEWKATISQKAQERASITSQQMAEIAANRSEEYYDYMKDNQHALGVKHTDKWKEMMSNRIHSEEEKEQRSESLKKAYAEGRRTSHFSDNEPWNKGTKGIMKLNSGSFKRGQESPRKIKFTDEQINKILNDTRSCKEIGKDYNVGLHIIWKLKKKHSSV